MAASNPWATSHFENPNEAPESAPQQTSAYAVPALNRGDAYIDEFGWAPTLAQRTSAQETPSAQRLGTIPTYDRMGNPRSSFMHDGITDRLDVDVVSRTQAAAEETVSTGWNGPSGVRQGDRRWADNPRRDPPPETRMTSRMSPNTWSFFRLFDQFNRTADNEPRVGSARSLNGMHFSMADHRRKYEILGMRPATSRRNTYRIEPTPWDVNVVDMPPTENSNIPEARILGIELPYGNRSMRLG